MDLKTTRYSRLIYFIPLLLSSIAIFIASHQQGVPYDDSIIIYQDKILHFIAYFIYGITIQIYLLTFKLSNKKYILLTILIGSLYGFSDEFHQYFIENRSSEFLDWVADTFGVTCSLFVKRHLIILKEKIENIIKIA